MPAPTRLYGAQPVMSFSASLISPAMTGTVPITVLSNVDLPAPLAPSRVTTSPLWTSMSTRCSTA